MPYEPKSRRVKIWQPLAFSVVLITGMLLGIRLQNEVSLLPTAVTDSGTNPDTNPEKIEEIIRYIEARYVDQVDRKELMDKIIDGIIKELDPHSVYLSKEEVLKSTEELNGNFEGIGIEFLVIEDTIVVMSPIKNGPSEKAGILAGDKIVAIGDSLITDMGATLDESKVVQQLRGKKGTSVNVGVLRPGQSDILHFDIIRDNIPIHSVDVSYMLTDNIGYIKVNKFSSTTNTEFLSSLEELIEQQALRHLVIDLRDNPGGYLQEATSILNQFFKEKNKLLVYTEGRNVKKSEHETTGRSFFSIENIAVLIDENSASASEIMAGAIQDWDRGVIIGRRSFGKGLVQERYGLRDGSALQLTVARYYTPSGRSIQRDYQDKEKYGLDIYDRHERGELYDPSKIIRSDSMPFYTNDGRLVYGGGGISPDIFIPLDSTKMSPYFSQIQPHIRNFVFQYYQKEKDRLLYSSIDQFIDQYQISTALFQEFQEYAIHKNPEITPNKNLHIIDLTKLYLKARLAKHLFSDEGLYAVLNSEDLAVQKAVQVLDSNNPLSILEQ